jgi:putative flippase GtrA
MKNQKSKESLLQFIKFGIVGVANTCVDWIVFYILVNTILGEQRTIAKAIAFIVAVLNSYIFNTIWTFKKEYASAAGKSGDSSAKSAIFGKFIIVSLIGWAVNVFVFSQAANRVDMALFNKPDLLPLIFASGAAILWNFFANKLWTYKK